ncbi:OLC1v1008028C1 [Oldenlandia corymbosa var. corymbosa]|uniref:OLC1v1008028C1 n=1 Tax=Oldenlandia corymbosa var. corymbosa TaxID=529605 RepID=A0AAV1DL58_OLDCO|nr:OLC1v1008028C1 [Oldenlandia corymbosa var. corymbosa]
MDLITDVLRMNEGIGENSYANNSLLQEFLVHSTRGFSLPKVFISFTHLIAFNGCPRCYMLTLVYSPPSLHANPSMFKQFKDDFLAFLSCRAEELVTDGRMVLTMLGRISEDPCSKDSCYIWELLAVALRDMVPEGLIEADKLDSFNIPNYTPSLAQVKSIIESQGSFKIDRLETSEIHWNAYEDEVFKDDRFKDGGYNVAKCMRAVAEPLLVGHFGEEKMEEVFLRYKAILTDRMSKEKTHFINVTASLIKRI